MTVEGNIIEYPGEVETKKADLTVTKTILNSVCSTKAALYMNMDIENYYLGTPLERYEYVHIPISMVPAEIMDEYNLHALVHNGYLYVEVPKGMYGLPQAGLLANVLLAKRLAKHGYSPVPHTWPLDAQVAPTQIFLGRRRFRSNVCWSRTRGALEGGFGREL
jgi:hypothetical protein